MPLLTPASSATSCSDSRWLPWRVITRYALRSSAWARGDSSVGSSTATCARAIASSSAAGVLGWPLLGERGHALTGVLGGEQRGKLRELGLQAVGERTVEALARGALDGGDGERRAAPELGRQLGHGAVQLVGGNQPVDHPQPLGLLGGNGATGRHQLQRPADSDQAGEALGATGAGQQPQRPPPQ